MPIPVKDPATGLYKCEIDQTTYEFSKWGAETALSCLIDLATIASKPFADIGAAVALGTTAYADLNGALSGLFLSLGQHKELCMRLIKTLASVGVLADGREIKSFDTFYSGKLTHLRKVVQAAGEVQLGDFFGDLKLKDAAGVKPTSPSPS